jgi:hypothetical protein
VVTVTAQNFNDALIDTHTIVLTPYSDIGLTTVMAVATDAGKQVAGWKCTGTVDPKFLPGSCK